MIKTRRSNRGATHIGDRLQGMDVINLGGDQLPDRRLNLRLCIGHAGTVDERRP